MRAEGVRTSTSPSATKNMLSPGWPWRTIAVSAGQCLHLQEAGDLGSWQEPHVLIRHAIEAADVATIGDADPQIRVNAAEGIDKS